MTLDELRARTQAIRQVLEHCWDESTRAPGEYFTHQPRSAGQCAVTALLVQGELGGHILSGRVNGQSHWYNWVPVEYAGETPYLSVVDLTADQFMCDLVCYGTEPTYGLHPYPRIRSWDEVSPETRQRMHLLRVRHAQKKEELGY